MQILLKNGGKTAAYECDFKYTETIYYPDGRVKYKLGEDDLTSHLRCIVNLEYQAKYGDVNLDLLDYYLYFQNDKTHLDVENRVDLTSVHFYVSLSKSEMDKIEAMTWR